MSSASASETSAAAAATSTAASTISAGSNLKVVGIILAITSGVLIGSSFVFKKKGLLRSQAGGELGEGVAYLKSPLWWTGMSMMIVGELCNFAAYAFVEAIVVTPLGALSVVICAILSSIFLQEKLSFFGWLGCGLCILGSVIIALNGPQESSVGQIREFQKLFLAPGFLSYIGVLITASLVIIFYFAPRYGKKSMLWYIFVCSMIGGISVSVTTGLGAAIVTTAMGSNQFKYWFMYFLLVFVVITLLTEVYYLNVALALFNTAMVTPTYYVIFTFFSMVTTIVLFQGLHASVSSIITLVMGFLVICVGITILQMSKVDPTQLAKLDRRSTILLQAARAQTEIAEEKGAIGYEDPGMDTLRGSFGTVGSIIRARTIRRMSQSSNAGVRARPPGAAAPYNVSGMPYSISQDQEFSTMKRHQLYDAPVPRDDTSSIRAPSVSSPFPSKRTAIKFDSQDVVHSYDRPGQGQNRATHEHREAIGSPKFPPDGYPPLPPVPSRDTVGSEANLLGMDSPLPSRLPPPSGFLPPSDDGSIPQILPLPPALSGEHHVHSAPPTMYTRYQQQTGSNSRKDSRDIFADPPSSRGTLLSFPSVTDSAQSQTWDPEEIAAQERERERERAKEKERGRAGKRYPRASGDLDKEESESLWKRSTESSSSEGGSPPNAGVRLVQRKPV